jgi:heat shock protein HtpX
MPLAPAPRSLAWRAALAVVLMVGFYGLAVGIAWGLVWIPYAEVRYAKRFHLNIAIFCLVGAFLIVKSIVPRRDRFEAPGPRLAPERQPRLFEELRRTAAAAGQEMPAEVYVVPDVNAWVSQRGGVMGLGSRRIMGLGLPLLQVLRVSEMRAVLAHEFGHYHGGDVALGPWIYKTRQALGRTMQALAGHSGILMKPFEWYGALFLRITHAISRRQELAADALAAAIEGAGPLARGLRATHGAAIAFQSYWAGEVDPVLSAGFRPPLAGGFARFVDQPAIAASLQQAVDTEAREGTHDPYDTHPSLRDRLAALGPGATEPARRDESLAVSLVDNVPQLEADLLAALAGQEAAGKLEPVSWDDVATTVYVPRWQGFLREHGGALAGVTPAALATLDWDAFTKKVASWMKDGPASTEGLAEFTIGSAVALVLSRRGYAIESVPGGAVTLVRDGRRVEPFGLRKRLALGAGERADWEALCTEAEIAELDLGRLASGVIP